MAKQVGKLLAKCHTINGCEYSIRVTRHALEQMDTRCVSSADVVESVLELKVNRLLYLQSMWENICLINSKLNITVIFRWVKNTILVLTVLPKSEQVFAKNGTWYECLSAELNSSRMGVQIKTVSS